MSEQYFTKRINILSDGSTTVDLMLVHVSRDDGAADHVIEINCPDEQAYNQLADALLNCEIAGAGEYWRTI